MASTSPTEPADGSEPTVSECCADIVGMCADNAASSENVGCGTGYTDKTDKASITGTDEAACCDKNTCSDLDCTATSGKMASTSPTEPADGSEPTVSECCADIAGMCAGNAVSGDNVGCGAFYTDKTDKTSIAGTTEAECCDAILNRCMSHDQAGVPYDCPSNLVAVELSSVATVAFVASQDCTNDAFDVTGVSPIVGYGPECQDPAAQATADAAAGGDDDDDDDDDETYTVQGSFTFISGALAITEEQVVEASTDALALALNIPAQHAQLITVTATESRRLRELASTRKLAGTWDVNYEVTELSSEDATNLETTGETLTAETFLPMLKTQVAAVLNLDASDADIVALTVTYFAGPTSEGPGNTDNCHYVQFSITSMLVILGLSWAMPL